MPGHVGLLRIPKSITRRSAIVKSPINLILALGVSWGVAATAQESARISVRTVGGVSPELTGRIVAWVSEQITVAHDDGPLVVKGKTLPALAREVKRPKTVRAVLVLADSVEGAGYRFVDGIGVVVVNVGALRPADLSSEGAKENFIRRVEKQAIGGVSEVLGVPACPFPRCAAYRGQTLVELDDMARNLCPPCMEKMDAIRGTWKGGLGK